MKVIDAVAALVSGLLINECSDISPWLANKLVRWAARHQYAGSPRAEVRAEEWASLIADRPGKLFKLMTAVSFAVVAVTRRVTSRSSGQRRALRARNVPDGRSPLWHGHNIFRIVSFLYACSWVLFLFDDYRRPWLALLVITVMGLWTVITVWRYWTRSGRTNRMVALDVIVVSTLFLCNEFILSDAQMLNSMPTVVAIWHSTMVTAALAQWGLLGGASTGVIAAVSSYLIRGYIDAAMSLDTVLLLGVGIVLGLASDIARKSTERLAHVQRAEAAIAERERQAQSLRANALQILAQAQQHDTERSGNVVEMTPPLHHAEADGSQEWPSESGAGTTS
ncbi:DUF5931 domain-containing protein [Saccharopolyspora shandongensis]|uniref:DUF5931 domain-containing protein n=1 Tax=Saccharopolyspora shandongensis TaxID=418495 RepID=UPI003445994B